MLKRKFLLFPFLIFFAAFAIDKLPFALGLQDYFLNTFSFLNYDHKAELKAELKEYLKRPDRRKTLVLFGNSRTMPFNNEQIERDHPDWILFNFSVPGGVSDYFLRYMEEFEAEDIRPDYIYFAVTPQAFNARPATVMDEVMLNGLTPGFVLRHADRYSLDDLSNYVAKQVFWTYQYRLSMRNVARRMRNDSLEAKQFREFYEFTEKSLNESRGSVFFTIGGRSPTDSESMARQAQDIWRGFFTPFTLSQEQLYFTEECLRIAQAMGVPARLVWPRVSPQLRALKEGRSPDEGPEGENIATPGSASELTTGSAPGPTVREMWQPALEELALKYGPPMLDMNYGAGFGCDRYYDASHLAGDCFDEFSDYLIGNIEVGR
ncbi:MAG: DUF1574 domain-containing protein [bacterium]|nr:DUF1574 domain-containing protein [bacterium]